MAEWQRSAEGNVAGPTFDDPGQTWVLVCKNRSGAIVIDGGSHIEMPGVMMGDNFAWSTRGDGTNYGVSLRVVGTDGPVSFGPSTTAEGDAALLYSFIWARHDKAIELEDIAGEFTARAIQMVYSADGSHSLVTITGSTAPVRWYHVTFAGGATPESYIDVTNSTGPIEVVNSFVWNTAGSLMSGDGASLEATTLRGNGRLGSTRWCDDACGVMDQNTRNLDEGCMPHGGVPTSLDCGWLDYGVTDTGLDVNGSAAGNYNGCAPDVGAFECMVDDCVFQCE
jgi:hypothetical protein